MVFSAVEGAPAAQRLLEQVFADDELVVRDEVVLENIGFAVLGIELNSTVGGCCRLGEQLPLPLALRRLERRCTRRGGDGGPAGREVRGLLDNPARVIERLFD